MTPWNRLIRFATGGKTHYGEPIDVGALEDLQKAVASGSVRAKVIAAPSGIFGPDVVVTEEILPVEKLLCPLDRRDVPAIRCIGLNYRKHIIEAGRTLPPFPSIFFKPLTCLAGPDAVVEIPKICQSPDQADYEGELCVVLGKTGKNISVEDAMSYVAGYTCGDDVSSRKWQREKEYAGSVPQWSFSKGFDDYAPIGPAIVSSKIVTDPAALHMRTFVNGEERQSTPLADLCFDVKSLISFMSTGTTLEAGTIIMTGTPGGVGFARKPEPSWLKEGDVVEVSIPTVGILRHTMAEEK